MKLGWSSIDDRQGWRQDGSLGPLHPHLLRLVVWLGTGEGGEKRGERRGGGEKRGGREREREGAGIVKMGRAWYLELYIIRKSEHEGTNFSTNVQCLVYIHGV